MGATKRSSPSADEQHDPQSNKKLETGTTTKRHHHKLRYRQPGSRLAAVNSHDPSVIEQQLCRALCITLFSAGFTSADALALSAFQAQVDIYMRHFALRVKQSMQHSRRAKPLPQDFIHALAAFEITPSSLLHDLEPSIPAIVTQQPVELSSVPSQSREYTSVSHFDEGSMPFSAAKRVHRYVPKHFPSFPAEHAYKQTEVYTHRETDPRRLRELSMQESTLAEQALRKLVAANRVGLRQRARSARNAEQEAHRRKTESVWRDALKALIQEDDKHNQDFVALSAGGDPGRLLDGAVSDRDADENDNRDDGHGDGDDGGGPDLLAKDVDPDQGVLVNYDRMYWRRGGAAHGKGLSTA